jgi:hypothetical protein
MFKGNTTFLREQTWLQVHSDLFASINIIECGLNFSFLKIKFNDSNNGGGGGSVGSSSISSTYVQLYLKKLQHIVYKNELFLHWTL